MSGSARVRENSRILPLNRRRPSSQAAWVCFGLLVATILWLRRQFSAPAGSDPMATHGDAGARPAASYYCPVFHQLDEASPPCTWRHPSTFLPGPAAPPGTSAAGPVRVKDDALRDLREAFGVMRSRYFNRFVGTWPEAIDWTAAVAQTVSSAVLKTYARDIPAPGGNEINGLFTETIAAYYGQDAIVLRNQAYDDILWVVLGWLEAVGSVSDVGDRYFPTVSAKERTRAGDDDGWYGQEWVPPFAHRARIFWDLAERGWDFELCGGGMVWSPYLPPYKNSITNELWISASAAMYLHFAGDNNTTPFGAGPYPAHDPKYLVAALLGYEWLTNSRMMNDQGLFIDGFHIAGWDQGGSECNLPNSMVYTYNQGVILSGQHHLWRATGDARYLADGHRLIQSVIAATGWDLMGNAPVDNVRARLLSGELPPWRGLGRGGILEEDCDAGGGCSQDGQTFKGIFFHHFAAFCSDIPAGPRATKRGWRLDAEALDRIRKAHSEACGSYIGWLGRNRDAALMTLDDEGRAGMWWGAGVFATEKGRGQTQTPLRPPDQEIEQEQANRTDYRNFGFPAADGIWVAKDSDEVWAPGGGHRRRVVADPELGPGRPAADTAADRTADRAGRRRQDPNDRGRGRTVETQIGLVALMRAYYQLLPRRQQRGLVEWGMGLI